MEPYAITVRPYHSASNPLLKAQVRIRFESGKIKRTFFRSLEEADFAAKERRAAMESVTVLTPGQMKALLDRALPQLDILASAVLGGFGGLRSQERKELDWKCIDLDRLEIKVGRSLSHRRSVKIEPTLAAWLRYISDRSVGEYPERWVEESYFRRRWDEVLCSAGLESFAAAAGSRKAKDAGAADPLFHSFGCYHLAKFKEGAVLAIRMGTPGKALHDAYDERVSDADADAWWQLLPSS